MEIGGVLRGTADRGRHVEETRKRWDQDRNPRRIAHLSNMSALLKESRRSASVMDVEPRIVSRMIARPSVLPTLNG